MTRMSDDEGLVRHACATVYRPEYNPDYITLRKATIAAFDRILAHIREVEAERDWLAEWITNGKPAAVIANGLMPSRFTVADVLAAAHDAVTGGAKDE